MPKKRRGVLSVDQVKQQPMHAATNTLLRLVYMEAFSMPNDAPIATSFLFTSDSERRRLVSLIF
jgi:hypothetical protein